MMRFSKFYKKYGIFIILLIVLLFFSIFAENFFTLSNFVTILRQVSSLGIVIMAMSMIMIAGGMDLSVGGQIAVGGVLVALMMANFKIPWPLIVLTSILIGFLFGLINGILAVKLAIPPMIVTLGTMLILQSASMVITGGYPIYKIYDEIKWIGQGWVGPIPVPVIIFVIIAAITWFLMNKTYIGHYAYAVGGNINAARLSGIDTDMFTVFIFSLGGVFVSIASLIVMTRAASAQPNAGSNTAFDAITAAVLGGISISGGEGEISSALVGVLIIGMLNNGLLLMGLNSNWQGVIKGIVLILAVGIDSVQRKQKKAKTLKQQGENK